MQIDMSDEQESKADSAMHESSESDSNTTVERNSHPEKHSAESISVDEGMQIDESDWHPKKTRSSIHESREPNSNVTDKSERRGRHAPKHSQQSLSTEAGMQMDPRVKQSENARPSIQERREPASKTTFETQ
jgi:hypothetical protein